jgi:hypothetical protein
MSSTIPQYIPIGAVAGLFASPTATRLINLNLNVPAGGAFGNLNFAVPDNTDQFATIGLQLARAAAYMISIAEAIQLISNEKGGIRVKDALDPYQYAVVTAALAANDLPVPPAPDDPNITRNPTGGEIVSTAADLIGLASTVSAVTSFGNQALGNLAASAFPGSSVDGATFQANSPIAFPDVTIGLGTISTSIDIITIALSVIARSLNDAVDVPSKALLMKNVLSEFQVALNKQATNIAKREPPEDPEV